jgi:hypothetical protein
VGHPSKGFGKRSPKTFKKSIIPFLRNLGVIRGVAFFIAAWYYIISHQ